MANIYTPQRLQGETQQSYKARRAASQDLARGIIGAGLSGGVNSRKQQRDDMRRSGMMSKRTRASDALMAAWAAKRITKAKLRDDNGAYTLTGAAHPFNGQRRMWLAGISAQRGY